MADAYQVIIDHPTDTTARSVFTAEAADGLLECKIVQSLNNFAVHQMAIYGLNDLREAFVKDALIHIDRRIDGIWYPEYDGFHRTPQRQIRENDQRLFTSYGRGLVDLLHRREILYPAISAYTLKSGPADDVMTEIVRENATSAVLSPPRLRPVRSTLTTAPSPGVGPNWFGQRSWKNLLDVLQEIAQASGVDFSVRRVGDTRDFEFYTGYPQLGTDLSASIEFNILLQNMTVPSYTVSATEESNIVAVLGQGQGTSRRVLTQTSGAENDSPWNEIESIVEASAEQTYNGLVQAGRTALEERKAKESFVFGVLQNEPFLYGRDYTVGDIVLGVFDDIIRAKKIIGATLVLGAGVEDVDLEFGDILV